MKIDLKRVDCTDVEDFCDVLTDNAVIATGLPSAGTVVKFGEQLCSPGAGSRAQAGIPSDLLPTCCKPKLKGA